MDLTPRQGSVSCRDDAKARGLCLRVTARTKSWSFIYRPSGSQRQRRYTIGDYPAWSLSAAREKALSASVTRCRMGATPVGETEKQRREALTVAAMIDRFIDEGQKKLAIMAEPMRGLLRRDVIPAIGDRPAGRR